MHAHVRTSTDADTTAGIAEEYSCSHWSHTTTSVHKRAHSRFEAGGAMGQVFPECLFGQDSVGTFAMPAKVRKNQSMRFRALRALRPSAVIRSWGFSEHYRVYAHMRARTRTHACMHAHAHRYHDVLARSIQSWWRSKRVPKTVHGSRTRPRAYHSPPLRQVACNTHAHACACLYACTHTYAHACSRAHPHTRRAAR